MLDGAERTVTLGATAQAYLSTGDLDTINSLTVADYTLLSNSERVVTMSGTEDIASNKEGLVEINAVSYNTTYSIDLDGRRFNHSGQGVPGCSSRSYAWLLRAGRR